MKQSSWLKSRLAAGHKESARQAYLWAQNFYDSATYFIDGSKDPTRFLPTWELLYDCWLKAATLFEPVIEPTRIHPKARNFMGSSSGEMEYQKTLIVNSMQWQRQFLCWICKQGAGRWRVDMT